MRRPPELSRAALVGPVRSRGSPRLQFRGRAPACGAERTRAGERGRAMNVDEEVKHLVGDIKRLGAPSPDHDGKTAVSGGRRGPSAQPLPPARGAGLPAGEGRVRLLGDLGRAGAHPSRAAAAAAPPPPAAPSPSPPPSHPLGRGRRALTAAGAPASAGSCR